jgi:hypothetical protein
MVLTSKTVLSVDATIIIGLLILLSFQSVGSPIYEQVISDFSADLVYLASQLNGTDILIEKYCGSDTQVNTTFVSKSDILEKCKEWELQKIEIEGFAKAELNIASAIQIFDSEDHEISKTTHYVIAGGIYVKIVTVLMILPFAVSAIIESLAGFYNRSDDSSGIGTLSMILGFGGIIIGMIYILFIMICSSPKIDMCL